ncbi:MAG: VOC family protein [Candidatus Dojkabacteria bacterium]
MAKQIFVNFPVTDLAKSTAFYEALGFTKDSKFSDGNASSMQWSEEIYFMILKKDFYKTFLKNKEIADTTKVNATLIALTLDSKEAVQKFAETAKANGGDFYKLENGVPEDMMFGLEVTDPDGNHLEPVWMNTEFNPHN